MSSTGVPKPMRKEIRQGLHKCFYCGKTAETGDHVTSKVKGGQRGGYANVLPACMNCNRDKGMMNAEEYRVVRFTRHMLATGGALPVCNVLSLIPEFKFYGEIQSGLSVVQYLLAQSAEHMEERHAQSRECASHIS